MSKRTVHGRARNVEVGAKHLYQFEMSKGSIVYEGAKPVYKEGGVRYKAKHTSEWKFVPFSRIAEGMETWRDVGGTRVCFTLAETGLEVKRSRTSPPRTIEYAALANFGRKQPELSIL